MKRVFYNLTIALLLAGCATTKTTTSIDADSETVGTSVATEALSTALDRTNPPEPGPAPDIQLGHSESFTLSNGLKVFVVENHKLPRIAFSLVLDLDPMFEGEKAGYISSAGQLNGAKADQTKPLASFNGVAFFGPTNDSAGDQTDDLFHDDDRVPVFYHQSILDIFHRCRRPIRHQIFSVFFNFGIV